MANRGLEPSEFVDIRMGQSWTSEWANRGLEPSARLWQEQLVRGLKWLKFPPVRQPTANQLQASHNASAEKGLGASQDFFIRT
eukprot:CAMPEP_0196717856 /NCGR_PEP_ID=MMETSP1091-20130531/1185_1 /TAXON_ID=302021 /ORGANISM="Rhodomonas sp., Strain CCMP768" /LENGTH=82 /DNA_ID=CAMNT_0042058357 /DNA_START=20 /DNA_END=266 /DNA_ORIENTATION=+